jgi:hypothetical protein
MFYEPRTGLLSKIVEDNFPLHTDDSKLGMIVNFVEEKYRTDNDFVHLNGYRVIMHDNYEFPHNDKSRFLVNFGDYSTLTMFPSFFEAHESLLSLDFKE